LQRGGSETRPFQSLRREVVVDLQALQLVHFLGRKRALDRALLTANANYYFTPQAIADFHSSLAPLGEPTAFEPAGKPVLRGGFVIQGYTVKYPGRTLDLSTFYEPGATGRIEQFLVNAGE